jgi:dihydrofolate synthase/folylpolyglutamate synthase
LGNYQIENVCTALYAINILNKYAIVKITTNNIRNGFENVIDNTGLFGRWQILNTNPLTICDTGHNIDGISAVVQQLAEQNYNKLLFVLGMVNDKDLSNIINILPKHANYYFCRPNIPRGLDADILKQKAKKFKLIGKSYNTVTEAYKAAKTDSKSDDLIFIGGSTFVVAEVV